MEDMFDGWLAMPSVADFLDKKPAKCVHRLKDSGLPRVPSSSTEDARPHDLAATRCDFANTYRYRDRPSPSTENVAATGLAARQRREHTKSRLGCLSCKKRKVKYPYLMHALLGLAGSHNALQVPSSTPHATLTHRQKAITGLEHAFTRWPPPAQEAHVMLATSYLLCFQSSYIADGFLENILSLRGCALLSKLILSGGLAGPFSVQADMPAVIMQWNLRTFPHLDQTIAHEALLSLKAFSHLLASPIASPIARALVASLVGSITPLLVSEDLASGQNTFTLETPAHEITTPYARVLVQNPLSDALANGDIDWSDISTPSSATPDPLKSFVALMSSLLILAQYPHEQLLGLFDPSDQFGQVVMAHFLAVRCVISPLSAPQTGMHVPVAAMVAWMEGVVGAVKGEWKAYVAWPTKILKCMKESVEKKRGLDFGDVLDMLVQDAGAFREGRGRK
ncbi:hypothetical protein CC86DRAFT_286035 [Ophiobolus disseminans]|uniref:Uncharacterized protein n=1 Tax=Ophiobolus disseminans TaxID=1469910 RepID=A0A6A7A9E1_9PLEO|nr:hypothetical protein CC86DRAFT_286035 [Ophiobolus disseminans]